MAKHLNFFEGVLLALLGFSVGLALGAALCRMGR
jgi:hypothetical protein